MTIPIEVKDDEVAVEAHPLGQDEDETITRPMLFERSELQLQDTLER